MRTVLTVLFIIACVILTVIVLWQEGKSQGLGTIAGAGETFWSKNKARSKESLLVKFTAALAAFFMIAAMILDMSLF
ncbi:MAG: preprotein translocase subunit SecG [Lachnospiraceae bacterium]|nr:preprotein translocase subunit SecG [Lachnospiraceae bacterium]